MKTRDELERLYDNLRQRKERLAVRITNERSRLREDEAKLREVNIRCDKLERYLWPDRKISQTMSERFRKLAKQVLPARLYNDIIREACGTDFIEV